MKLRIDIAASTREVNIAGVSLRAAWGARLAQVGAAPGALGSSDGWIDGRFLAMDEAQLLRLVRGEVSLTDGPGGPIIAQLDRTPAPASEHLTGVGARALPAAEPLAHAQALLRRAHAVALLRAGVHIVDVERVCIDLGVQVEAGATLWPDVVLRGQTILARGVEIRPGCWIEDCRVGAGTLVLPHSVCTGATLGPDCQVGPMAHLRPGTVLIAKNKVGNFVEVKKSTLHHGAKASHLSYLGDAEIGANANIGAGTITCNYDGHSKHRTAIGAGAFIGSNTALVAPVTVGEGAVVGAGSTITQDVPDHALAVERAGQRVHEGLGRKLNERNARKAARARGEG